MVQGKGHGGVQGKGQGGDLTVPLPGTTLCFVLWTTRLVPEHPLPREHHGDAMFISRGDDLGVAH